MASAIFFGGRRINIPGAYSVIDASALVGLAPGAVGTVALVGTSVGGKPQTVEPEFADATRPETSRSRFRSGDLKIASQFAFAPSNDPAVPAGAQRIVSVKVNTATQSTATLSDALLNPALDLTSADWGQFTEQINVEIEAGTLTGKKITIIFEDTTEELDDVGGNTVMDLLYTPGAAGYTTATGAITPTQFIVAATKTGMAGLDAEITADILAPGAVRVVSSDVGDAQSVTVFGLDGSNVPISETLVLDGTTPVNGVTAFTSVTGSQLSAAAAGTITISDQVIPTTIITMAPAVLTRGLLLPTNTPAAGVVTLSASADTAGANVVIRGLDASGTAAAERFSLATALTTPVVGVVVFSSITSIELGDVAIGVTSDISLNAFLTTHAVFETVQKVVDKLNATAGFTANAVAAGAATFLMTTMDFAPAVNILSVTGLFLADLNAVIEAINEGSNLVVAARATNAIAVPDNTGGPVFLTGGTEGLSTVTEWQSALDLLKKRRVNIIVVLTNDAAIHAQLQDHLKQRAGRLRSEANGYVGLGTALGAGETRANIKSRIILLQDRNLSAISQEVQRFDPDDGIAKWWPPYQKAALAAGMQAGSVIAEPLTHKLIQATDVRNDASWSITDDQEELIDAGLMMSESVDGLGIRWVRSITTHLKDDNLVFTEMSANESVNTSIFDLRRQLELFIGSRALRSSVSTIIGKAQDVLEKQLANEIIFAFRSLTVSQVGDVFPVSVEISPIVPINFIPITVHLVVPTAAAA